MSSSARTSPPRRPYDPDGYGRRERGAAPPQPGRRAVSRSAAASGTRSVSASRPRAAASADRLLSGAPAWLPPAAVLGGPMLAAILGKLLGGYHGPVFVLLTIVAAGVATAAATPNGRWWVVCALPPVAWLVASVAELAWHNPAYPDTKAKAVGLVHATTNVFPVILAALVVMGLVIAAAVVRGRQSGGGTRRG